MPWKLSMPKALRPAGHLSATFQDTPIPDIKALPCIFDLLEGYPAMFFQGTF
jgi:hypothetical protein